MRLKAREYRPRGVMCDKVLLQYLKIVFLTCQLFLLGLILEAEQEQGGSGGAE